MVIKPNGDGTYTLYCCNGSWFKGTYRECQYVVARILNNDVSVRSLLKKGEEK